MIPGLLGAGLEAPRGPPWRKRDTRQPTEAGRRRARGRNYWGNLIRGGSHIKIWTVESDATTP